MSGFTLHARRSADLRPNTKTNTDGYDALRHEDVASVMVNVRAYGVAEHDEQVIVAALRHATSQCLALFERNTPFADVKLNMAEAAVTFSQDMLELALKGAGIPEPLLNRVVIKTVREDSVHKGRMVIVVGLIGQDDWEHRERVEFFPSKGLVNALLLLA